MPGASHKRRLSVVAAMAAALALAGCGLGIGANRASKAVSVRITGDFGTQQIGTDSLKSFPSHWTDMQFTQKFFTLKTSDGGGFVDAIDGHTDDESSKRDWFYYVNGIEAPEGAATTDLHPGDHVWWDLHDWSATDDVPAVVGSYPEPFTTGSGGQAYPTAVTCASGVTKACDEVTKSLDDSGVKVSFIGLGTGNGSDSLAMLVGTYSQLRGVIAAELLQGGPKQSGVYGEFVGKSGQAIELLNPKGDVADTLYGSAGMIAAINEPGLGEPVWLVTGTDTAGVDAAAKDLTAAKLADHFAVAISASGKLLPLPVDPSQ